MLFLGMINTHFSSHLLIFSFVVLSIPFLGESNYQKDFRGFRVTNNPGFLKKNPVHNHFIYSNL